MKGKQIELLLSSSHDSPPLLVESCYSSPAILVPMTQAFPQDLGDTREHLLTSCRVQRARWRCQCFPWRYVKKSLVDWRIVCIDQVGGVSRDINISVPSSRLEPTFLHVSCMSSRDHGWLLPLVSTSVSFFRANSRCQVDLSARFYTFSVTRASSHFCAVEYGFAGERVRWSLLKIRECGPRDRALSMVLRRRVRKV